MITAASAFVVVTALATGAPVTTTWRGSPKHPLVVFAHRDTEDAAMRVIFRAGAADDGIEYGLTRLSQYALLRGQSADSFRALDAAVYAAAGELDVITGVRHCAFALSAPRGAFDGVAVKVLQHLLSPQLSTDGIKAAQKIVITGPLEQGGTEDLQSFIAGQVLFLESTDGGGDYSNPVWGDRQTLGRIEAPSVRAHVASKLTPANAIIVVAGRFDEAKLKKVISAYKGGTERSLARPDVMQVLPRAYERWAPREIHMQVQAMDATSTVADVAHARVVTKLASERVFWKFRKMGHTYSPGATILFEEWLDFIVIAMTVAPNARENHEVVLRETLEELAAGKFTADEIARAKAQAKGELLHIEDDARALAASLEPMSRKQVTVGPEVIAAVDAADDAAVRAAAAKLLDKKRGINFLFGRSRAEQKR